MERKEKYKAVTPYICSYFAGTVEGRRGAAVRGGSIAMKKNHGFTRHEKV